MESIDKEQIFHIAKLSRLQLSEGEAEQYAHELAAVLDHAAELPELNVPTELSSLRTEGDESNLYPNPQSLLQNATAIENGFVKVPSILDKEGAE